MKKIGIIVVAYVLATTLSFAAESSNERSTHAIGYNLGWVQGSGISYRHHRNDLFLQMAFGGSDSAIERHRRLNVALSGGKYLIRIDDVTNFVPVALALVGGVDVLYDRRTSETGGGFGSESKEVAIPKTITTTYDNLIYTGLGLNIEFGNVVQKGLSVFLSLQYTMIFRGFSDPRYDSFAPVPASGIFYNW